MRDTNDAKDLMSETLLRAYAGLEKLRNRDSFIYFLFAIAKRVHLEKIRYQQRHDVLKDKDFQVNPSEETDIWLLKKAMLKLPVKEQEALQLFEVCGFSIKEIAEIQQSNISLVKIRLFRSRKKLRKLLEDKESRPTYSKENAAHGRQGK